MEDEEQVEFRANEVRDLQNEDFALNTTDGITLYASGCSMLLFYDQSPLSKELMEIWLELADIHSGVNFYGVDFTRRRNIMKRFSEIKNSPNHMFNRYTSKSVPFILVYREDEPNISYPQAFYNGEFSTSALNDFVMTLACEAGYNESPFLRQGIYTENNTVLDEDGQIIEKNNVKVERTNLDKASGKVRKVINEREDEIIRNYRLDLSPTDPEPVKRSPMKRGVGYIYM